MTTKLIQIGNSRGIRIPKPLLEESGLSGRIRVQVVNGGLLLTREEDPRTGWGEAAARLTHQGGKPDPGDEPNDFDVEEWEW